jgi:hypothetical protein
MLLVGIVFDFYDIHLPHLSLLRFYVVDPEVVNVEDPNPHSFWSAGSGSALGSARCTLLRNEDFSCSLDVKKCNFFSSVNLSNFWLSKPWIWIWICIRIHIDNKCWIRIRVKTRFHNTAQKSCRICCNNKTLQLRD